MILQRRTTRFITTEPRLTCTRALFLQPQEVCLLSSVSSVDLTDTTYNTESRTIFVTIMARMVVTPLLVLPLLYWMSLSKNGVGDGEFRILFDFVYLDAQRDIVRSRLCGVCCIAHRLPACPDLGPNF